MDQDIYAWPSLLPDDPRQADDQDMAFASWGYRVRDELTPVYDTMSRPLHDDPTILDTQVNQKIDGWLARVQFLANRAEWWYRNAEQRKLDQVKSEQEKVSMAEAEVRMRTRLAPYRFVRDELSSLADKMERRINWAQSYRKVQVPSQ